MNEASYYDSLTFPSQTAKINQGRLNQHLSVRPIGTFLYHLLIRAPFASLCKPQGCKEDCRALFVSALLTTYRPLGIYICLRRNVLR